MLFFILKCENTEGGKKPLPLEYQLNTQAVVRFQPLIIYGFAPYSIFFNCLPDNI